MHELGTLRECNINLELGSVCCNLDLSLLLRHFVIEWAWWITSSVWVDPLDVFWIVNWEVFIADFISLFCQENSSLSGCDGSCLVFEWDPLGVFWIALCELMLICKRRLEFNVGCLPLTTSSPRISNSEKHTRHSWYLPPSTCWISWIFSRESVTSTNISDPCGSLQAITFYFVGRYSFCIYKVHTSMSWSPSLEITISQWVLNLNGNTCWTLVKSSQLVELCGSQQ